MELTVALIPDDDTARVAALSLLNAGLGTGYMDAKGLAACAALGASLDGELAGVILARMPGQAEAEAYAALAEQPGAGAALAGHCLGLLQSVVVKQTCRGQGVGSALCRAVLDHLRRAGATAVLAMSWESGAPDTSAGVFKAAGFRRLARLEEFWKEDSLRRGYQCPRCGNPCRCAAVLYLKPL